MNYLRPLAALGVLLLGSSPALAAQTVKKHNILLVVADDLGFSDLSALGSEIQTPNLDKLLANGRLMLDFHAAPNCSPMVFKQGPDVLNPGWQFIPGASWRHPQGPASSLAGLDNHPVVQVTLEDAQAYARWSGRELPSEAQLEYAMRGGLADADFSWGASELPKGRLMANTWQGQFPYHNAAADGFTGTSPVGCFPANGLGLLDAGGNVWELTRSGYRPGHDAQRDAVLDPPGPKLSDSFDPAEPGVPVAEIKGGSHLCSADRCMRYRPSARQPQPVFMATSHVGFRTLRQ